MPSLESGAGLFERVPLSNVCPHLGNAWILENSVPWQMILLVVSARLCETAGASPFLRCTAETRLLDAEFSARCPREVVLVQTPSHAAKLLSCSFLFSPSLSLPPSPDHSTRFIVLTSSPAPGREAAQIMTAPTLVVLSAMTPPQPRALCFPAPTLC